MARAEIGLLRWKERQIRAGRRSSAGTNPRAVQTPNTVSPVVVPPLKIGRLVATPNALANVPHDEMLAALQRHVAHDWGDVCPEDKNANDEACRHGFRVLSVYRTCTGIRFWIITEADRSSTCVLLPEDY